ncbi:MAG: hypothetical protein F6K39_35870 [Okeania sp. SIO3B3]|nr:hypothetical protein [Okeania sp. SIO3B3]
MLLLTIVQSAILLLLSYFFYIDSNVNNLEERHINDRTIINSMVWVNFKLDSTEGISNNINNFNETNILKIEFFDLNGDLFYEYGDFNTEKNVTFQIGSNLNFVDQYFKYNDIIVDNENNIIGYFNIYYDISNFIENLISIYIIYFIILIILTYIEYVFIYYITYVSFRPLKNLGKAIFRLSIRDINLTTSELNMLSFKDDDDIVPLIINFNRVLNSFRVLVSKMQQVEENNNKSYYDIKVIVEESTILYKEIQDGVDVLRHYLNHIQINSVDCKHSPTNVPCQVNDLVSDFVTENIEVYEGLRNKINKLRDNIVKLNDVKGVQEENTFIVKALLGKYEI